MNDGDKQAVADKIRDGLNDPAVIDWCDKMEPVLFESTPDQLQWGMPRMLASYAIAINDMNEIKAAEFIKNLSAVVLTILPIMIKSMRGQMN